MPIQIPRATQQLRPVATNAPQLAQPDLGDQGQGAAAVAGGLNQAAQTASQISNAFMQQQIALQEKRNAERAWAAEVELQDAVRSFTTRVQETRRGANADGLQSEANDWFEGISNSVLDALENDDQRQRFSVSAAQQRDAMLDSLASFESQQKDVAFSMSAEASIGSWQSFAGQNAHSEGAVRLARQNVLDKVDEVAARFGQPDDMRGFESLKATTGLHRQVFENLLSQDVETARAYFENWKGEIDGQQWDVFENELKVADDLNAAQKAFDGQMQLDASFSERRKNIRESDLTPEARRLAESLLDQEKNRLDEEEAQAQRDADNLAYDEFVKVGHNVSAMDPAIYAAASGSLKRSLAEQQSTDESRRTTNWQVYWEIFDDFKADPVAFSRRNYQDRFHELNIQEQLRISNFQNQVIQSLLAKDGEVESMLTNTQMLDAAFQRLGLLAPDNDRERREFANARGAFEQQVNQQVLARQRQLGRTLEPEEKQDIINGLTREVQWEQPPWFFGLLGGGTQSAPAFQLLDPGILEDTVSIDDIPEAVRDEIRGVLEQSGEDASDANVLQWWGRMQAGGGQ